MAAGVRVIAGIVSLVSVDFGLSIGSVSMLLSSPQVWEISGRVF